MGSGHVSHRTTSVFDNHLHHNLIILKMYSCDSPWEECVLLSTRSTSDNCSTHRIHCPFLFQSSWVAALAIVWMEFCSFPVLWHESGWFLGIVRWTQHFNNHNPEIKSKESVHSWSSIQQDNFRICRTVGYWRLFLAHPTDKDKCSTSEDTEKPTRS